MNPRSHKSFHRPQEHHDNASGVSDGDSEGFQVLYDLYGGIVQNTWVPLEENGTLRDHTNALLEGMTYKMQGQSLMLVHLDV